MKLSTKCMLLGSIMLVGVGAVFTWILCVAFARYGICFKTVMAFLLVAVLEVCMLMLIKYKDVANAVEAIEIIEGHDTNE